MMILLLNSCLSVSKLYEYGDYQTAYEKGIKKVVGSKKMKEKDLIALEAAYYKLQDIDLSTIRNLEMSNDIDRFEKMARLYRNLQERKVEVSRLWKTNQNIVLVDYSDRILAMEKNAFELYYSTAKNEFSIAKNTNQKQIARNAYHLFLKANRYENSVEIQEYINESLVFGTVNVGVYFIDGGYREDRAFADQLLNMNLSSLSSFWVKYHWMHASEDYDRYVDINLVDIELDNEKEIVDIHHFKSTVDAGFEYKKDNEGKLILDSLCNPIKIKKFEEVCAEVTEFNIVNNSFVRARISVYDRRNGSSRFTRPVEAIKVYRVNNVRYTGDLRAIDSRFIDRCRNRQIFYMPNRIDRMRDLELGFRNSIETNLSSLTRELI